MIERNIKFYIQLIINYDSIRHTVTLLLMHITEQIGKSRITFANNIFTCVIEKKGELFGIIT